MRITKLASISLLGVLLLTGVACGPPAWCSGKYTSLVNYEYGYEVFYPEMSTLSQPSPDSLNIYMSDAGSVIRVKVYDYPTNTAQSLHDSFKANILDRNEPGEYRDVIETYDYQVARDHHSMIGYCEMLYTFTYDCADEEPYTVKMRGETLWVQGKHGSETYIYMFQYETLADCDECIENFDWRILDTLDSVIDFDYLNSLQSD